MRRIVCFAFVGGVGFVVDAAVLSLLLARAGLDPFSARLLSIAVAMLTTWMLNRALTFAASSRHIVEEGLRYGGVGATSAVANYVIYCAVLLAFPAAPPVLALIVASAAAMFLSYAGYSRLVFDR